MNGRELLKIATRELNAAGVDHEIAHGGKHLQLRWRGAGGAARMIAVSWSPSHRNARNRVRGVAGAKEDGANDTRR